MDYFLIDFTKSEVEWELKILPRVVLGCLRALWRKCKLKVFTFLLLVKQEARALKLLVKSDQDFTTTWCAVCGAMIGFRLSLLLFYIFNTLIMCIIDRSNFVSEVSNSNLKQCSNLDLQPLYLQLSDFVSVVSWKWQTWCVLFWLYTTCIHRSDGKNHYLLLQEWASKGERWNL